MPDATSKSIPTAYIEEEELPGGDGRRWEEEQLTAAVFHPGAKDAKVYTQVHRYPFTRSEVIANGLHSKNGKFKIFT